MAAKFDIFRKLPNGQPLWIEVVDGFESAKIQLHRIAAASPGEYFIFNSQNGSIIPYIPSLSHATEA